MYFFFGNNHFKRQVMEHMMTVASIDSNNAGIERPDLFLMANDLPKSHWFIGLSVIERPRDKEIPQI
jgi:hypothetical protein